MNPADTPRQSRVPATLTDGTVELSPATESDIPAITHACQDPGIAEYTSIPSPYTDKDAHEFVNTYVTATWEKGGASWAIRRGGQLVGMIDLQLRSPGVAEIGYWVHPSSRGSGVMHHAVPLVLDFGFDSLELRRITWRAVKGNWASWRAVWRYGFQREGLQRAADRDHRDPAAPWRDLWTAALLPTDAREPATRWDGPDVTPAGTPLPAIPDARDPEALVRQFHHTYRMPISSEPANVDIERIHMRMALIAEEFAELMGAVYGDDAEQAVLASVNAAVAGDAGTRDAVESADALADMIYVIYGMALECGIPLDAVLHEVQRSNMSKLSASGEPIYREDGKVLKGPGFFNPKIAEVLESTRLAP